MDWGANERDSTNDRGRAHMQFGPQIIVPLYRQLFLLKYK